MISKRKTSGREDRTGARLAELPVRLIVPNRDQPRRTFDEESIRELAASIEQVGLIQPLVVRRSCRGYELIAGERRLRAVRSLGAKTVRCLVEEPADDGDPALMAIVENLQREDLHFFEEAECFSSLMGRMGVTQEELGARVGKSQSYIANKLRLMKLSPGTRRIVVSSSLTERHARALLRLRTDEERELAAERMAAEGMSIREAEKLVDSMLEEGTKSGKGRARRPKMIRIFKDYRVFLNTVGAACEQLRESGLAVSFDQNETEGGIEIVIGITQPAR
ncbi:MAG: ParB/RepB/Spo0J family partition protein [Clostridia bacterium]|nr:ParB/RepB/Spo0J family partition protein [Clostridia bacterium]